MVDLTQAGRNKQDNVNKNLPPPVSTNTTPILVIIFIPCEVGCFYSKHCEFIGYSLNHKAYNEE